MSSFQDMVAQDIHNVFLDLDEFGEIHRFAGRKVRCVFDEDQLKDRQGTDELNIGESTVLVFARCEDLPKRQVPGNTIDIDGRIYEIDDWREDMGMATLTLHQNRSR